MEFSANRQASHHLTLSTRRSPTAPAWRSPKPVGITERAARKIMGDLEAEGYIERKKVGRLNQYRINTTLPFWRGGERGVTVRELLELLWRDRD